MAATAQALRPLRAANARDAVTTAAPTVPAEDRASSAEYEQPSSLATWAFAEPIARHGGSRPANVPWCKLQRGPACMRASGTPLAAFVVDASASGVTPCPYRSARRLGRRRGNGPLPASHQS